PPGVGGCRRAAPSWVRCCSAGGSSTWRRAWSTTTCSGSTTCGTCPLRFRSTTGFSSPSAASCSSASGGSSPVGRRERCPPEGEKGGPPVGSHARQHDLLLRLEQALHPLARTGARLG